MASIIRKMKKGRPYYYAVRRVGRADRVAAELFRTYPRSRFGINGEARPTVPPASLSVVIGGVPRIQPAHRAALRGPSETR